MKRVAIEPADAAKPITEALPKGVLLTTKADGEVNSMVIGWGTVGINWGRPVFAAYIRVSRHTRELLDKNPEFTVNVPVGELNEKTKKAIRICGSKSGRDMDKIAACGLTAEDGLKVSVPAIAEFPLTLECRVIYRQQQDADQLPAEILDRLYPTDESGRRDVHITYFGEILAAYQLAE